MLVNLLITMLYGQFYESSLLTYPALAHYTHTSIRSDRHSITFSVLMQLEARWGKGSYQSYPISTSFSSHLKSLNYNSAEHNGESVSTCLI